MSSDQNSPNGMHPQDMRNLIIFLMASVLLWFAYDKMVLQPKAEALRAQKIVEAAQPKLTPTQIEAAKPRTKDEVLAEGARIKIDTPQLEGTFSLKGARIDDVELKNYFTTLGGKEPVAIYSPVGTENPYYAENGWLADDATIAVPNKDSVWKEVSGKETLTPQSPVTLEWDNGQGLIFKRRLEIDDKYMFTITQSVENKSAKPVTLYAYSSITHKGIPKHSTTTGYEGPLGYIGQDLHQIAYPKLIKEPNQTFDGPNGWIGFGEKYWLTSFIPDQKEQHTYRFTSVPAEPKETSLFQVDARSMAKKIDQGATTETVSHLFVGAKEIKTLDMYEDKIGVKKFSLSVDFGMLYFLTRPLYFFLTLFNSWVGNFGLAIIMMTCLVRLAVFPLASASYRSFAKMKKVAPRMAELKVKYGNDKPKMQQELIKLYETEKVNPMAGCFPLLLQIPIFFAVYKVISISIEMRHAPFFGWIHDLSEKDPISIFNLFGLLPFHVPEILHIGPWSVAMCALMWVQQRLNPPPTDPIQKDMVRFMPWVMTFVLSKFPSGLVIYWTFSNLISLLQQYTIMRQMGVPVYILAKDEAIAHAEGHKDAIKQVVEKAKIDAEYLKHRAVDVEEALFDAEDKLMDAVEGKASPENDKK